MNSSTRSTTLPKSNKINEESLNKNRFPIDPKVNVNNAKAKAVIYTKITPTSQKTIPKALVRLHPTQNLSLDCNKESTKQKVNKKAETLIKNSNSIGLIKI